MGCGCNNKGGSTQAKNTQVARMSEVQAARPKPAMREQSNYSSGYSCKKCLLKHVSKAAVELQEFVEDQTRYDELSFCIGDMACAEDHARGLGLTSYAADIRAIRGRLPDVQQSDVDTLRKISSSVTEDFVREARSRREVEVREAMDNLRKMQEAAAKAKEDSNDAGAS